MSQQHVRPYEFDDDIPLRGIDAGTNVLVAGPSMSGARTLALRLVTAGSTRGEGTLVVTTNKTGKKVIDDCERLREDLDRHRFAVVDCVSEQQGRSGSADCVETVSSPGDLTGIGIELSSLYQTIYGASSERVRLGLFSISTLLMYTELRTVSRFIHTVTGRVTATDGLGVFFIDPTTQDERAVNTLSQLCDARIDVRDADGGGSELRVRGLADQPRDWTPF